MQLLQLLSEVAVKETATNRPGKQVVSPVHTRSELMVGWVDTNDVALHSVASAQLNWSDRLWNEVPVT